MQVIKLTHNFYYQMNSFSPIRTLDQGRDSSLDRLNRLKYQSLRDRRLEEENLRLRTAVERSMVESRRQDYYSRRSLEELAIQNEGLNRQLIYNVANTTKIENSVNLLIAQNQGLKDRLAAEQVSKAVELESLRRKYMEMQLIGRGELEQTYTEEVGFLLREIDRLKIICEEKSVELDVQFKQRMQEKQEYDANICKYIAEINNLKNLLLIQESQKNQEIRELSAKTELERSRTVGIIGNTKESTNFMDREIRKLTEEINSKNSQLDELTKNYLGEKKKNDEQTKSFNEKVAKIEAEHSDLIRDKMNQFEKRENLLKEEILDQKRKETELHMKIDQMENQYQILQHQSEVLRRELSDSQNDHKAIKDTIEKERQEHLQEITKLMNQKIRRRSSKMLSSQRSFNSSLKDSNIVESREDIGSPSPADKLPVVREEVYMRESKQSQEENKSLIENNMGEEDTDYNALINHYENMLDEVKKSHNNDMQVMKLEIQKMKRELAEKQEEFEDLLKRFTPLVKIHAGEKTIQEDRKERMERHWKADIALLQILLDKYKIQAF